jgi:hypothetical protein
LNKSDGENSKDWAKLEAREIMKRKPVTQVHHSPAELEAIAEHITEIEANYEPSLYELPTTPDLDGQQGRNKLEGES